MGYIFKEKEYSTLSKLYEDFKDESPVGYVTVNNRIKEGLSIKEALFNPPKKRGARTSRAGTHIVEGNVYKFLNDIAEAYGMNQNALYKRYSRGKRGDDLVPLKKRKNYVEPVKEIKYKLYVEGKGFKSEAEACKYYGVKVVTYKSRKYKGYSIEECLGIKENPALGGRRINSRQRYHKSKEVIVNKVKYVSIADAAREHNKTPEQVSAFMNQGRTIEQALGVEDYETKHSIEYKGKTYKNKKALAKEFGLSHILLSSRISLGYSLEEALEVGDKIVNEGKFNRTILERDKNLASKKAVTYFIKIFIDERELYKIGITTKSIKQRLSGQNYQIMNAFKGSLMDCFELEQTLLKNFKHRQVSNIKGDKLDGYTEIFDLSSEDIIEIKKYF